MKLETTLERIRAANPAQPVAVDNDGLFQAIVASSGDPRFAQKRRTPTGRKRLVLVAVVLFLLLAGTATATYLVARGNGEIALGGGLARLLVVNPDRSGLRAIARCPAGDPRCTIFEPAWSPDGTQVAFVRGRFGRMSLYVAAADGKDARRLAGCGQCAQEWGGLLGWSPDGSWIAFSRTAGQRGQESLWVVAAAGGGPHRLTDCHAACADVEPTWSPHGQLLLFHHISNTPGASGLYTIRPDGSGLTKIADGEDPAWSPNGRSIAFDSGPDSIAVANADGSHVHVLFAGARDTGARAPSWSPDGHRLVFFKTAGQPGRYRAEIWTMNPDGSGKERLYHSGCCVDLWAPPIWSPDGRVIAFSANSAGGTLVINADGSGLQRLIRTTAYSLSWQPLPNGDRK
jgi:Tol biopolymer transport system component